MLQFDRRHLWHPYTSMAQPLPVYPVANADGAYITLTTGQRLLDGMASWWSAIHGYNHPVLNEAIRTQLDSMAHVMFGGLTHAPAVDLAKRLVQSTPEPLECVFFADSGSVSVEVAIKAAIQFHTAQGRPQQTQLLALRRGYHGDTLGAMSVCDPVTGMHSKFAGILPKQIFIDSPECTFGEECMESHVQEIALVIEENRDTLAAVILEPIVQGAGGMRFYSPGFLQHVRRLCDEHGILLICDEIATGFGRTGKMFAVEYADITPDIMCVGKALTGGYVTLAAMLTTRTVAEGVSHDGGPLMHGPTFMANPLACAVANASIDLLVESPWQDRIAKIATELKKGLSPCSDMKNVRDVRVLGGIGVVETIEPVDVAAMQARFVELGVWVRPFANLVYVMPPYIVSAQEVQRLTGAICEVVGSPPR